MRRTADRQVVQMSAAFSGPLPPPALLEKYEQISPGASERIFKQWESQSEHRQGLENRALDSNIRNAGRGQWLGAYVATLVVGVALFLLMRDKDGYALAVIIAEVVALAAVFMVGRRRANKELGVKRAPIQHAARAVHSAD